MLDNLEQVLEDCLSLIDQGVSIEDCLSSHPQLADELEPPLRTALAVQEQLTPRMPQAAKRRARVRGQHLAETQAYVECSILGRLHNSGVQFRSKADAEWARRPITIGL